MINFSFSFFLELDMKKSQMLKCIVKNLSNEQLLFFFFKTCFIKYN